MGCAGGELVICATANLDLVTEALITKHQSLPLFKRGKRLFVGIADPMQSHALDEIKFHSNHMVEPVLVERGQLRDMLLASLPGGAVHWGAKVTAVAHFRNGAETRTATATQTRLFNFLHHIIR